MARALSYIVVADRLIKLTAMHLRRPKWPTRLVLLDTPVGQQSRQESLHSLFILWSSKTRNILI